MFLSALFLLVLKGERQGRLKSCHQSVAVNQWQLTLHRETDADTRRTQPSQDLLVECLELTFNFKFYNVRTIKTVKTCKLRAALIIQKKHLQVFVSLGSKSLKVYLTSNGFSK